MGKMHSDIELNTVPQRLRALRKAAKLTQEQMEDYKINLHNLRSWEIGRRTPKQHHAEKLVSIFKEHGIDCTINWIMTGEGTNPLMDLSSTSEKDYLGHEILRFKNFYPEALIVEVKDNMMIPLVRKGDFVGGVMKNEINGEDYNGTICIVETEQFGIQVRLVEKAEKYKFYNLISLTHEGSILNTKLQRAARVIFLRSFEEINYNID